MRPMHHELLDEVFAERRRLLSRRGVLRGTAKVIGGGAIALAAAATISPGMQRILAQAAFETDVDVLNFALTLEHLEFAFYRDGLEQFTDAEFGETPFNRPISEYLTDVRDHEGAHVDTLTSVIQDLGGEPVSEAEYDFGYTDGASFLATAQALENTGVSAYDGAADLLSDQELLTAAGTIVAVEARHASFLNLLNGVLPFPAAFETPLPPAEVLEIAGPFIVGGAGAAPETPATEDTDAAVTPTTADTDAATVAPADDADATVTPVVGDDDVTATADDDGIDVEGADVDVDTDTENGVDVDVDVDVATPTT